MAEKLVKDSLRLSIMSKRQSRGESEIKVEFNEIQKHEVNTLTEEELSRRERRRTQNREAAKRCRLKKKLNKSGTLKAFKTYSQRNTRLLNEIKQLKEDKLKLEQIIEKHIGTSQCMYNQPQQNQPQYSPSPNTACITTSQNQHIQYNEQQEESVSTSITNSADFAASTHVVTRQFSIPSDSFTDLDKLFSDFSSSTLLPFGNYSNQSELADTESVTPDPNSAGFQVLSSANTIAKESVTFFGDDFVPDDVDIKPSRSVKTENVEMIVKDRKDDNSTNLSLPDFGKLLFEGDNLLNQNYINAYLNPN